MSPEVRKEWLSILKSRAGDMYSWDGDLNPTLRRLARMILELYWSGRMDAVTGRIYDRPPSEQAGLEYITPVERRLVYELSQSDIRTLVEIVTRFAVPSRFNDGERYLEEAAVWILMLTSFGVDA